MAGSSSTSYTSTLIVDDFYFSALFDEETIFPVSDENYANQIHLQEVLMSSVISSNLQSQPPSKVDCLNSNSQVKTAEKETGQTSQSFCNICYDYKQTDEMFSSTTCMHTFCKDCISKYVASKIQQNMTRVDSPDTNCSQGFIGPDVCHEIVPKEVLDRWENVLCESLITGSQKFYCPFKDCSAMMLDDSEENVTVSECPNCRRLFCAQCKVAWHAGIDCNQFQSLNENERDREDIMLVRPRKAQ